MMEGSGGGSTAPTEAAFPAILGAAVIVGGGLALLANFNKRAAYWSAGVILLGIMVYRDVPGQFTQLVDAIRS